MLRIVSQRKIWFSISGALLLASVVLLSVFGLKPGIDFTGGALFELTFLQERPALEEMQDVVSSLGHEGVVIQPSGEQQVIIRTKPFDDTQRRELLIAFSERFGQEVVEDRFESIGPTIGEELRRTSISAVVAVLVAIVLYIAYAFRKVSGQLSSWKLGVVAIAALVHDIVLTLGVFAVLGATLNVEVDTLFVTALLMVLGYSVNDTIVVFDRVRKNILAATTSSFEKHVNSAVHQTLVRSINTSVTTMLVLLALFFLGGESLRWFVLALLVGVIVGTYSSIFFASPLLVTWQRLTSK